MCLHIATPAALSFNLSGVDEYLNCSTLVAWCHMLVIWEDCFNWRALLYFHYDSFDVVSMFNAMMVFNKCLPFETFLRCSISILEWRILLPCKALQGFLILSPVGKTPYKCSCFVSKTVRVIPTVGKYNKKIFCPVSLDYNYMLSLMSLKFGFCGAVPWSGFCFTAQLQNLKGSCFKGIVHVTELLNLKSRRELGTHL